RLLACLMLALAVIAVRPAAAAEPIQVPADVMALDLTSALEIRRDAGSTIQVSTAPGADGIVRRIEVRSRGAEANPTWAVFALANSTD
ncbi:hypothetical protein ACP3WT_25505, partial [Salmonella enterica]|uniref:hypothetical protein n=1 Tax=Salmonella enterica TaxID=28901 RepID=UPI003CFA2E2D